ncbi:MAG: RNA polymerase sigma-70 factor, partial [Bacteroidota bacterium]
FLSKGKEKDTELDIRSKEGFTLFYDIYAQFVFDICYRYLDEIEASQNITAEIFTSLWERREILHEDDWSGDAWKRYLSKAAKHKLTDHLRREDQSKRYLSVASQEAVSFDNSTEELLHAEELSQRVNEVVNQLPTRCKEVYQLSREQGLSYQEISDRLSISVNTVNKHITKALKSLRANLEDYQITKESAHS